MKSDVKRLCDIKSLRELRSVRRENEILRIDAGERVKERVNDVFSFSDFLAVLIKECAPFGVKRVMDRLFPRFKE